MTDTLEQAKIKFMRAKSRLLRPETCFYGTILAGSEAQWTDSISTAAVGMKYKNNTAIIKLMLNPDFVNSLDTQEVVFLLAHEAFHALLQHLTRINERDPQLWNIACDLIINDLLVTDGIGSMPKNGLLDQKLSKQYPTSEGMYTHLKQQAKEIQQQMASGAFDEILQPENEDGEGNGQKDGSSGQQEGSSQPMTKAQIKDAERQIKNTLAQAKAVSKMAGSMSAGLEIAVDNILQGRIDWETLLFDFCTERSFDETSWQRPNRRYVHSGMYMPGKDGTNTMERLVLAIDVSGSHVHFVEPVVAEVTKVHEDMKPELHVIYFDSKVTRHDVFGPDETPIPNPCGGGGTAFSPIWAFIEEHKIDPKCCCVLTDMECWDWGDEPSYPVLWLSTETYSSSVAPFGKVVKVDLT